MITRGKLTVAQASLPAHTYDCVECGGRAIFLVASDRPAVEHRCATGAAGPVWTLIERPGADAEQRAAVFAELAVGGVQTLEQARAALLAGADRVRDALTVGPVEFEVA